MPWREQVRRAIKARDWSIFTLGFFRRHQPRSPPPANPEEERTCGTPGRVTWSSSTGSGTWPAPFQALRWPTYAVQPEHWKKADTDLPGPERGEGADHPGAEGPAHDWATPELVAFLAK